MSFPGFTDEDFAVFTVPGLDARMEQIKLRVRPKLEQIGAELAPFLSALCGEEMFYHVAKHARRTVNPPNDTWVAWSDSKKGYKARPHFQFGLWSTHLFIQFAVIYEYEQKAALAEQLEKNLNKIKRQIPGHYFWSADHTKPDTVPHQNMSKEDLAGMIDRLKHVKKAELLCGVRLDKDDEAAKNGEQLLAVAQQTFETLLPLYRMAK